MRRLILQRLAFGLLTLWLISLIVFAAMLALPGDAATAILGREATPDRVAALRDQLNLEDSVVSQYLQWIGGVVSGELRELGGNPAAGRRSCSTTASPTRSSSSLVAAARRDPAVDRARGVDGDAARPPGRPRRLDADPRSWPRCREFVIGIGLILLFATSVFNWFPAVSLIPPDERAWNVPDAVVLPAATLVLAVVPYISRIMRGSMVEVLESEYVTMARLKGLPEREVIWRHAVPNAVVPAIQVTALQLAWMAGGVVVVEFVFSYPGIGQALVDAVANRDMPVVQTVTMLGAAIYVLLNLLADVPTIVVTPKLRTAAR